MIHSTNAKAILSGDILEMYEFQYPISYGFDAPKSNGSISEDERTLLEKEDIQKRSLHRTRGVIRRLINANSRQWRDELGIPFAPRFVTLTFADNLIDLTVANDLYTNFIKRLNYDLLGSKQNRLKYTVVPEFQKRGAVHYHSVVYNLHWLDSTQLARIWSHGFVNVRPIEDITNVGLYMTKYMTKDAMDERLEGRKRHFSSRGLFGATFVREQEKVIGLSERISNLKCSYFAEYDSDYQGLTKLSVYDLSSDPLLKADIHRYLNG